jgi:4-amino-4-deoxy-L-arabinose transferase-like glycosyltransferase
MTTPFAFASAQNQLAHRRASIWLTALCLIMFLPGFVRLQPMDRDEPRFAQATKQMLETGDFVDIRFQTEARHKKPVGVYWLQAAAVSIGEALGVEDARRQIWLYRLPSLAAAIAAVLLTYWAALAFLSSPGAFWAAALFAATILIGVEARLAKTDAIVTMTVVAAMGALARVWRGRAEDVRGWTIPLIFWSAIALGVLVKGPITPMVPFLAALTLSVRRRSWRWLAPLRAGRGLLLVLAIVAPWLTLILLKTNGSFLTESVGQDMLGKVASGKESHGAPPGTYLAAFWLTAWPMAPFFGLAIPAVWRGRGETAAIFLIAWALPSWLAFEATPTKLPHYVLPLYPALAILTAWAMTERAYDSARGVLARAMQTLLAGVPIALVLGVIGGAFHFGVWASFGGWMELGGACLAAAAIGLGVSAARRLAQEDEIGAVARAVASAAALTALAFAVVLPGALFEPFRLSPRLAEAGRMALADAGCARAQQILSVGYREPSLVFLTRTDLSLTDGADAGRALASRGAESGANGCRLAFVESAQEKAFATARGDDAPPSRRVTGVNLNGGRRLDIGVYVAQ